MSTFSVGNKLVGDGKTPRKRDRQVRQTDRYTLGSVCVGGMSIDRKYKKIKVPFFFLSISKSI